MLLANIGINLGGLFSIREYDTNRFPKPYIHNNTTSGNQHAIIIYEYINTWEFSKKKQCADMLSVFPEDVVPTNTLVVRDFGEGLSLLNFHQQTQRTIQGMLDAVGASPDGSWLSYTTFPPTSLGDWDLVIESASGKNQRRLQMEAGWQFYSWIPWLDSNNLWIPVWNEKSITPTILVFNAITGERQVLLPDYPDFAPFGGGSYGVPFHFGFSNVAYEPSLKLVVYPQGKYIALWDREAGQTVTKILRGEIYGPLPLWLPQNNAFVVAGKPDKDSSMEWMLMGQDGEIRRLTHFGNLNFHYQFGDTASLSPDGRFLAFGLYTGNIADEETELFILNLQTLEVVDTCIKFDFIPYWSLDSQYLAVNSLNSNNELHSTVVLNIEQGWAVDIFDGLGFRVPVGWLKNEEQN